MDKNKINNLKDGYLLFGIEDREENLLYKKHIENHNFIVETLEEDNSFSWERKIEFVERKYYVVEKSGKKTRPSILLWTSKDYENRVQLLENKRGLFDEDNYKILQEFLTFSQLPKYTFINNKRLIEEYLNLPIIINLIMNDSNENSFIKYNKKLASFISNLDLPALINIKIKMSEKDYELLDYINQKLTKFLEENKDSSLWFGESFLQTLPNNLFDLKAKIESFEKLVNENKNTKTKQFFLNILIVYLEIWKNQFKDNHFFNEWEKHQENTLKVLSEKEDYINNHHYFKLVFKNLLNQLKHNSWYRFNEVFNKNFFKEYNSNVWKRLADHHYGELRDFINYDGFKIALDFFEKKEIEELYSKHWTGENTLFDVNGFVKSLNEKMLSRIKIYQKPLDQNLIQDKIEYESKMENLWNEILKGQK